MASKDLAEKMLALVEQRQSLSRAYRSALGSPQSLLGNDLLALDSEKSLRVAIQDYKLGSFDNLESVVDPVLRRSRQEILLSQENWFSLDRGKRGLITLAILIVPLLALIFWRNGLNGLAFLGAALAVGLPYLFFQAGGQQFSFSSGTLETLKEESLWRSGLSILTALILTALLFDLTERRRRRFTGRVRLDHMFVAGLRTQSFPFGRVLILSSAMLGWTLYLNIISWLAWFNWQFGLTSFLKPAEAPVLPDFNAIFLLFFAFDHFFGLCLFFLLAPIILSILISFKRQLLGEDSRGLEEGTSSFRPPENLVIKA